LAAFEQINVGSALRVNKEIFGRHGFAADAAIEADMIIGDDGAVAGSAGASVRTEAHVGIGLQPAGVRNECALPREAGADDGPEAAEVIAGHVSFAPEIFVEIRDGGNRAETPLSFEGNLC